MSRPPLRTVALQAGVSEPTVSRVLNGRDGVAAATRRRVLEVLSELGHVVPDQPAVPDRRRVVGLVCGEFDNPVFATFTHHISQRLGRAGYLTTVAVHDQHLNPEERCVEELMLAGVAALVFIGGHHAMVDGPLDGYEECRAAGVPVVLVNGRGVDLDVPQVFCDEEEAAFRAGRHLLELGHRRIGCIIGGREWIPSERFMLGLGRALRDVGLSLDDDLVVETSFTLEGGRAGGRQLIEHAATATICGNDLMALGALQAAADLGLDSAGEFSVVGYDGTQFTAYTRPALTTLRQPFEDMARHIAAAVISELDGTARYRKAYVFAPQLVARDTTGAAVEAPVVS